ncbi:hypothetical protein KDAU_13130 [Dictyobacter aurantiacus]|uniref:Uncharacterized protein n=2 Tax=Dictyobacter aurantiacus TaxID=1936993 RepID=A0A401ZAU2_9CHLR|nr:hypothetical protein KDAU_13130 [Dictyobacter aurantiacus]
MSGAAGAPGVPMAALPNTPQPSEVVTPGRNKGRPRIGVWLTILVLCAVVAGTVGVFAYQKYSSNPQPGSSSFTSVQGPSGTSSVEQAASIIQHAQTSSGIDANYNPVNAGKKFAVGQKIYISFDIQSKTKPGYIEVKWYSGKHMKDADTFAHDPANSSGYFSTYYDAPAQGTAELYWCTRANCSDAQLAQVLTFTVASYQSNS